MTDKIHELNGIDKGKLNSSADRSITSLSIQRSTCAVLQSIGDIGVVEVYSKAAIRNGDEFCHGRVDIVVIEDIAQHYPLSLAVLRLGRPISLIIRDRLSYSNGRKG